MTLYERAQAHYNTAFRERDETTMRVLRDLMPDIAALEFPGAGIPPVAKIGQSNKLPTASAAERTPGNTFSASKCSGGTPVLEEQAPTEAADH